MAFKPASKKLKQQVQEFMLKNRGKLYHKIPHPDFAGLPAAHDDRRFAVLKPHLGFPGGTVLDIGAHWGQFAHWLEDLGYRVTAVEHAKKHAAIARGIRDICDKKFDVLEESIFDVPSLTYDIVLALNVFHHFLKTESGFESLIALLQRLDCRTMFFQAHVSSENQMQGAFRNFDAADFATFVAKHARLPNVDEIGSEGKRKIYKLWR